jgi:hypothetical protein
MLVQVMSGYDKSVKNISSWIMLSQVMSDYVRLGQVTRV